MRSRNGSPQRCFGDLRPHSGTQGVSRITPGTMNVGELTDEADSVEIMDAVLHVGIHFVDVADHVDAG